MDSRHDPDTTIVAEAVQGYRGPDAQRLTEVCHALTATLLRKNHDYGAAVWQEPVLCPGMSARSAILVRMSDKIGRLRKLLASGDPQVAESIDDTLADLAGYCLLELANPNRTEGVQP